MYEGDSIMTRDLINEYFFAEKIWIEAKKVKARERKVSGLG